jgi:hypothetical protein
MGFLLGNAGAYQGTNHAAGRCAGCCTERCRGKRAGRYYRAEARNGDDAQAGQQAGRTAQRGADAGGRTRRRRLLDTGELLIPDASRSATTWRAWP